MAQTIAKTYIDGQTSAVRNCTGFVMAQEIFNLLKECNYQLAVAFYDDWCYYRYTGRCMER